jgi:hypothetical protein
MTTRSTRSKLSWRSYHRARNREHAHHEAGRAFMEFFLGRADRTLIQIDMRAFRNSPACVRRHPSPDLEALLSDVIFDDALTIGGHKRNRRVAIREAMVCLAGPAAGWKVAGDPDGHWFHELWEIGEDHDRDLKLALRCARNAVNGERQARQLLSHAARWTDELLEIPRVWNTVEALAKHLPHGKRLSGAKAARLMRQTWGEDDSYPLLFMGPKWLRRML